MCRHRFIISTGGDRLLVRAVLREVAMRYPTAYVLATVWLLCASAGFAAGDLTRQEPVEVRVELGSSKTGDYRFHPERVTVETGKLVKLVLHNPSDEPHYFSSPELAARVFTRKVQVMDGSGPGAKPIGEVKGAIREIEVYPGGTVEWFFVPVATGALHDLHCSVRAPDGKTHQQHGMVGSITIQ